MDLDVSQTSWTGVAVTLIAAAFALAPLGILAGAVVLLIKRGVVIVGALVYAMAILGGARVPDLGPAGLARTGLGARCRFASPSTAYATPCSPGRAGGTTCWRCSRSGLVLAPVAAGRVRARASPREEGWNRQRVLTGSATVLLGHPGHEAEGLVRGAEQLGKLPLELLGQIPEGSPSVSTLEHEGDGFALSGRRRSVALPAPRKALRRERRGEHSRLRERGLDARLDRSADTGVPAEDVVVVDEARPEVERDDVAGRHVDGFEEGKERLADRSSPARREHS